MEMDWRLREGAVRLRKVDTGCERTEGREGLVFFEWNAWYTYSYYSQMNTHYSHLDRIMRSPSRMYRRPASEQTRGAVESLSCLAVGSLRARARAQGPCPPTRGGACG